MISGIEFLLKIEDLEQYKKNFNLPLLLTDIISDWGNEILGNLDCIQAWLASGFKIEAEIMEDFLTSYQLLHQVYEKFSQLGNGGYLGCEIPPMDEQPAIISARKLIESQFKKRTDDEIRANEAYKKFLADLLEEEKRIEKMEAILHDRLFKLGKEESAKKEDSESDSDSEEELLSQAMNANESLNQELIGKFQSLVNAIQNNKKLIFKSIKSIQDFLNLRLKRRFHFNKQERADLNRHITEINKVFSSLNSNYLAYTKLALSSEVEDSNLEKSGILLEIDMLKDIINQIEKKINELKIKYCWVVEKNIKDHRSFLEEKGEFYITSILKIKVDMDDKKMLRAYGYEWMKIESQENKDKYHDPSNAAAEQQFLINSMKIFFTVTQKSQQKLKVILKDTDQLVSEKPASVQPVSLFKKTKGLGGGKSAIIQPKVRGKLG